MIRVVDLFGNQYPVPSNRVSTSQDLMDELIRRYEVPESGFTLYCRAKNLLNRVEVLDESLRDGTVAVALVSTAYTQVRNDHNSAPFAPPVFSGRFCHFHFPITVPARNLDEPGHISSTEEDGGGDIESPDIDIRPLDASDSNSSDWSDDTADFIDGRTHGAYRPGSPPLQTFSSGSTDNGQHFLEASDGSEDHSQDEVEGLQWTLTREQIGHVDRLTGETGINRATVIRTLIAAEMDVEAATLSLRAMTR
jgi:hypothetical protein